MKLFTKILPFSLLLLATSCKNDIAEKKLYYGSYECINNCNREYVDILANGKYRYKLLHQNKVVYAFEDKYQVEEDKNSPKTHVYIVLNNWKNAVNPNYKDNILGNCGSIASGKTSLKGDAVYFQVEKVDDSFWSSSKQVFLQRHPDFNDYNFRKITPPQAGLQASQNY